MPSLPVPVSAPFHSRQGGNPSSSRLALTTVTALFFMWGFITCLNDILIPHLKAVFALNYFRSSLIQFSFFGAYFLISLPAGKIVARLGYQRGMIAGLLTCAAGALLFQPAASQVSYPLFLGALFVLASGTTILQVAANPYVSVLGDVKTASSRLNLAQAFNSLGTTVAPFFGGWLILAAAGSMAAMTPLEQAASVKGPYLFIAVALGMLALLIGFLKLPSIPAVEGDEEHSFAGLFEIRHLVMATIGIFLYVGAEVSIGSYLINFMGDPEIGGLSPQRAAHYVAYYWGGAMVGRFIGSALLQKMRPNRLLMLHAATAVALLGIALCFRGQMAMWAAILVGLCNSIMFPTLFTLGIAGLEHRTSRGSSLLIMAIVGGAIIPVLTGRLADAIGIQHALIIPVLCYLYIVYFGIDGWKPRKAASESRI